VQESLTLALVSLPIHKVLGLRETILFSGFVKGPLEACLRSRRDVVRAMVSASAVGFVPLNSWAILREGLQAADVPRSIRESVRERIRQGLANGESTGLAISVVSGDQIVWEEGFGWADRAKGLKVTPHSAFSLQSTTKPFFATLVTTFAAEGKLSLYEPANRYLGLAKILGPNGDPEKVTVRLLGAHASGLPSTYQELYNGDQSPSPDSFLSKYGRLAYPPGETWEYSNIGFEALGGIVTNLTGKDYGALMSQRVLEPLGLRDSFWDTDEARISEGVTRYTAAGDPLPFYLTTTPPSGELFASAHDAARFAMWNMKVPLDHGSSLMDNHWVDELHKPVYTGPNGAVSAFGWALDRLKSGTVVIHKGGGGSGVSTTICMVPERKLACTVLANHQHAEPFTHAVCDLILGNYLPDWKMPEENGNPPRVPFVLHHNLAGRWAGTLKNDGVTLPVELDFQSSQLATLTVGSHASQKISNMTSEGNCFLGVVPTTVVDSQDALHIGAKGVAIRVLLSAGKLVGRLTTYAGPFDDPRATLPFVINLTKVR
jgi:CubicO group peptidase (beta-lactamase class C family)